MSVLSLCTDAEMPHQVNENYRCSMGVDTGKDLHVVILKYDEDKPAKQHVVHLGVCQEFSDLDRLMKRYKVEQCVIDGLPETHATRDFAHRHPGRVHLCFFNEHQRGSADWDRGDQNVFVNRTEALDASRAAIRNKMVVLPRRNPLVEAFAHHLIADAKMLDVDEETGIKKYRYVRLGEDHFSLAFTYAWMTASQPWLVNHRTFWAGVRQGKWPAIW